MANVLFADEDIDVLAYFVLLGQNAVAQARIGSPQSVEGVSHRLCCNIDLYLASSFGVWAAAGPG